jgi:hypothetical protein
VRSLVEERGTTVMLTTHDLGDIEDICRRIVIISINLGTAASTFWVRSPWSMVPMFVHQLGEFAKYPITIYSPGVQALIVIAVPFAFVSFFPTAFLFAWMPGARAADAARGRVLHADGGLGLPARPASLRKHRPLTVGVAGRRGSARGSARRPCARLRLARVGM